MSSLAMAHTASTRKGFDKRQMIIEAAATLLREGGPEAVSHRSVAKLAGCSLSATTYYFDGLEDLLHQAGLANMSRWSERAERAAFRARKLKPSASVAERIDLILAATLPDDENIKGHYEQLVSAGSAALVASAYQFRQRLLSQLLMELPSLPSLKDEMFTRLQSHFLKARCINIGSLEFFKQRNGPRKWAVFFLLTLFGERGEWL